jgi:hypothetical protein
MGSTVATLCWVLRRCPGRRLWWSRERPPPLPPLPPPLRSIVEELTLSPTLDPGVELVDVPPGSLDDPVRLFILRFSLASPRSFHWVRSSIVDWFNPNTIQHKPSWNSLSNTLREKAMSSGKLPSSDDSASLKQNESYSGYTTWLNSFFHAPSTWVTKHGWMQTSNWMLVSAPTCFLKHHQPVLGVQEWLGLQKLKTPWACVEFWRC